MTGGMGPLLHEVGTVVRATSVAVKSVCGALLVAYALSFSEAAVVALSCTPGYFWPPHFWVWTAFTHCFLEIHLWSVVIDVVVVVMVGKLLEPLWGALEMFVFFVVVNALVALVSAFFYYILYMVTFNPDILFGVHIHGLSGYLAGVSVAVKQVMPDHVLYRSPLGKITNRNIPLSFFILSLILWAIGIVEGSYCTMFGSGLVVSWIYLRFYQVHSNGARGDMADGFAFHTFFPNVIQPPIALVGNTVFSLLVRIKVCKRPVRRYDFGGGGSSSTSSISISLPGVESQDTERRRQIALKALSERLNKAETVPLASVPSAGATGGPASAAWPSLDEAEEDRAAASPSVHISIGQAGAGQVESTPKPDQVSLDVGKGQLL